MRPALLALGAAAGCIPALTDPTPLVDSPRVLAVVAEPAEVEPGEPVRLSALVADADGVVPDPTLDWALCGAPRPLAELGPVDGACTVPGDPALIPAGAGATVDAEVPLDACSLFGPNPPPPVDGAPAGRPADPDPTGGYTQPVLVFPTEPAAPTALGGVRLRCGLPAVTQETAIAWNRDYRNNTRPAVAAWSLGGDPLPLLTDPDAAAAPAAPGAALRLEVSWPTCPDTPTCGDGICSSGEDAVACPEDCTTPVGCAGAEPHVLLDPARGVLTERRETISVAFYATAGAFRDARAGVAGGDASAVGTVWTAPDRAGPVWLAAVIRDDRGGVGFVHTWLEVDGPAAGP